MCWGMVDRQVQVKGAVKEWVYGPRGSEVAANARREDCQRRGKNPNIRGTTRRTGTAKSDERLQTVISGPFKGVKMDSPFRRKKSVGGAGEIAGGGAEWNFVFLRRSAGNWRSSRGMWL